MVAVDVRIAEVRSEDLITELLTVQGWDTRRPPQGDLLRKQEYKDYPALRDALVAATKSKGGGSGIPECILVDRQTLEPLAIFEAKAHITDFALAAREAQHYGDALRVAKFRCLAIAVAGTKDDRFQLNVFKWDRSSWKPVTYEGRPVTWLPNREQIEQVRTSATFELRPSIPSPEVLKARGDEINGLLRDSSINDPLRPGVMGAIMLGLWKSRGQIRRDPKFILGDINASCKEAFLAAGKSELARSIRVDAANQKLAIRARRICDILERLGITSLTAEHDYLGTLYEHFFRYTGGNTIGQYFTPRHITEFMADLCSLGRSDVVLDPACGTGGFLIAAMQRMQRESKLSRSEIVKIVKKQLIGLEDEPMTAALCVANMILRGDGTTGVRREDCFGPDFPLKQATVVLMNPPFPSGPKGIPTDRFVDRALEGLTQGGRAAIVVPLSLLVRADKRAWRDRVRAENTLNAVISLPDELFQPYASSNTAVLLLTKGIPHPNDSPTFFARIENDGFRMRKTVRVERAGSQIPAVLRAYRESQAIAGLTGMSKLETGDEWTPGAYIPAKEYRPIELLDEIAALIRTKTATVIQHVPQLLALRAAIESKELIPDNYRAYARRTRPPEPEGVSQVASYFEIYYGQQELEDKQELVEGKTPVISSSGIDNGYYGFFDFQKVIAPPIITVPRTGSIGEAHVQEWACGATSDCLILVPRKDIPLELFYIAAAVIRREKWRFSYGRKITPTRLAVFPLPTGEGLIANVHQLLEEAARIETVASKPRRI